jgi:hypothetical protein
MNSTLEMLTDSLIGEEDRFLWLSKENLKAETESEIVAAQNQTIQTEYYATKILNTQTDSKCRLCQQFDETIDHIISACHILAKEQYIKRHDRVCAQPHFNICKETGVQLEKKSLERTCPKISKNRPERQRNHTVESTSSN